MYIYTSRARASWVTEVSREGRTYKDKGEPIGTAADRLAGTAVGWVISWKSLSLMFLAFDIFVWCCHCLLNWLAPDMSESWQSSEFSASLNLDNLSCCLLFVCTSFSPQHFNFLTSLSGTVTVFWSGLRLLSLNLDSVFLVLRALFSSLLFSVPDTPYCLLVVSYTLQVSTLFTSLLSSTIYSSSHCLHFSSVSRALLSVCVSLRVSVCSPSPLHTVASSASVCSVPPMHTLGTSREQQQRNPHPSHRRASPHRRQEPLYTRKHRVSCDFKPPSPGQRVGSSHSNVKCKPGYQITMAQCLKSFKDHLSPVLAMGTMRAQHQRNPHPSHRRGSPHWRREPLRARKHSASCDSERPNITLTQQFHCDLQSLPCKSPLPQPLTSTYTSTY